MTPLRTLVEALAPDAPWRDELYQFDLFYDARLDHVVITEDDRVRIVDLGGRAPWSFRVYGNAQHVTFHPTEAVLAVAESIQGNFASTGNLHLADLANQRVRPLFAAASGVSGCAFLPGGLVRVRLCARDELDPHDWTVDVRPGDAPMALPEDLTIAPEPDPYLEKSWEARNALAARILARLAAR